MSYCGIVAPPNHHFRDVQRCLAIDVGCWKLPKATHQIVPQQFAKVIATHVIQVVTWGKHVVSHPKIGMGSWFEECCAEMPRSNETEQKNNIISWLATLLLTKNKRNRENNIANPFSKIPFCCSGECLTSLVYIFRV